MCEYVYEDIYIYIYIYKCVCVSVYIYVCVYVCTQKHEQPFKLQTLAN